MQKKLTIQVEKSTSTTGAKRNVGIYAVNGQDADNDNNKVLTMTTATKMTLGDGAVGIYSKRSI